MTAPQSVTVLNGEVEIGDKVAFAVREGNNGALRTGEVVDIVDTGRTRRKYDLEKREYFDDPVIRVKIRITSSSGYYGRTGNVVGVEIHNRIARMS